MKKFGRWKSFDFGTETSVDERPSPPKKQKSLNSNLGNIRQEKKIVNEVKNSGFDFHKQITPRTVADLAVHPKKVKEVESWLKNALENHSKRQTTQFVLVTGPTGCGKATTIHILCKLMNVTVTEWVNPVDIDFEILRGPGQVEKFSSFFSEGKYSSLFSTGNEKKIFLVKDIPNAFVRNPEEFFNVLEDLFYKATNPVLFVCTDSNSNEVNLQRLLFPEEISLKYAISHISFNACAPSVLKKGLKRAQDVIQGYPELFCKPTADIIEAVLASSMGDIRCAMNQLYLACLVGGEDLSVTKTKREKSVAKRKRTDKFLTAKSMIRDETLGLFHGLGRVLNPKRKDEGNSWRLNCDVQKLVDEFSIQPAKFTAFLFENYLKYFGDLEEVQKSSEYLSLSTRLMENWDNHDTLVLALWISVLGLMVFNVHKEKKWNQIRGPRKLDKVCSADEKESLHPTDRFYYNTITKTQKYHRFNCDF